MKKKLQKLTVFLSCFIILFMTTGCFNKKALTSKEFKSIAKKEKYTVNDETSIFDDIKYVKKVYMAKKKKSKYEIRFYELSSNAIAEGFYQKCREEFQKEYKSGSKQTTFHRGNRNKYTLKNKKKYKVVSRIGNTVIFIDVSKKYKKDVDKLLEKLGY